MSGVPRAKRRSDPAAEALDDERAEDDATSRSPELAAIVEQLPVGIIVLDSAGRLAWMNSRAGEIFGAPDRQIDAGRLFVARELDGTPLPRDETPARRALRGETIRDRRLCIDRPDGKTVTVELTAVPVTSGSGGVVVMLDDVTERDRIERADAEFVENAAHQLRNPIAAIMSSVAALEAGAKDDPAERERFLVHVARESARMQRVVESLLTLAGVQRGARKPLLELIPLRPLVDEVLASTTLAAGVHAIVACGDEVAVVGDHELLAQALGNVLANAAEHTSAGPIRVRAKLEGSTVVVDVTDAGPGVADEARSRVFDRFYRGSSNGRRGSGLGLAIAQAAFDAMHGALTLLDQRGGEGATFRVTMPGARLL